MIPITPIATRTRLESSARAQGARVRIRANGAAHREIGRAAHRSSLGCGSSRTALLERLFSNGFSRTVLLELLIDISRGPMHALSLTAIRSARSAPILRTATVAMLGLALAGCTNESARSPDEASVGKTSDTATTIGLGATRIRAAATAVNTGALQNPVLFVTQVPTPGADPFAGRMSTFANHLASVSSVPRGGDLMIRYPDGSVRNLTREAGYGMDGLQTAQAIAVREPTVHWDGRKAVFSMVVGAPPQQYAGTEHRWQLDEVTGLEQGGTAVVTKV
ncbi:MAG: hypothetical protein IT473_10205, partial [Lysobacter sp.]|nr:hypothetical protein [Lysobacter sp.]